MGSYTYDETNRMVKGVNDAGEQSYYFFNGLGVLVTNEWVIAKNNHGYHDVTPNVESPAAALENANDNNGAGHGNSSGKTSDVIKDFVIDYNSYAEENLMEYELFDEGLTYRYVYSVDKLGVTAYTIPNGSASVTTAEGDLPLYYHMDHMGSSEFLTSDVTQRITGWTSYDEWGNITHNAVLKCGERELDLVKTYTGHERDSVLGMYYAKARMYDTADKHGSTKANKMGDKRFTAVDPVKGDVRNPQSMVQYTYVINNPLMYTDPLGEYYIQADTSGKYISYKAIKETGVTATLKSAAALDPTGVLAEGAISIIEEELGLKAGNSKDGITVISIAADAFEGKLEEAAEKSAEKIKKDLGKKIGFAFLVKGVVLEAAENYSIVAYDNVIFTLGEATNLLGKRYSLDDLVEKMSSAHEFVAKYSSYFLGNYYTRLNCSPGKVYAKNTFWEDDYEIFLARKNREELIQQKVSDFVGQVKLATHGRSLDYYSEIAVRKAYTELLNDAATRVTEWKRMFNQEVNVK
ncbi:MAG: hypothetical protein IKU39_07370 [Lachnospiraceae bacterium]|nr:hypothetical protein [Lachnospiraceae bacterium]